MDLLHVPMEQSPVRQSGQGIVVGRVGEPLLQMTLLGTIAANRGEPQELATIGLDRIDDNVSPKAVSILSQAPPLGLKAAITLSHFEAVLRSARGPIFLGVEAGKMLTDDLLRLIPFDALSASVPVTDDTVWVEHKYRIVSDLLNKNPVDNVQ
jgi:hypothetical protein